MNRKTLFLLGSLSFFLVCPISVHAKADLATNFYVESGKKSFEEKDYDLAVEEFNKALLADPSNEEAIMYLRILGYGRSGRQEKITDREQGESPEAQTKLPVAPSLEGRSGQRQLSKESSRSQANLPIQNAEAENSAKNLTPRDIEEQIAQEENEALKAVRVEASEKERVALKKIRAPKDRQNIENLKNTESDRTDIGNKPPTNKIKKDKVQKRTVKKSKSEKRKVVKKAAAKNSVPKDDSLLQPENVSAGDVSTEVDACKFTESSPEASSTKSFQPVSSARFSPKAPSTKSAQPVSSAKSSSGVPSAKFLRSAKSQEAALIKRLDAQAQIERNRLHQKFSDAEAQKIKQVHAKYQAKGIGPKEKIVFKDFDGDGVVEKISWAENQAIEKIQTQTAKEEKAALKVFDKKADMKERAAVRDFRAEAAKTQKAKKITDLSSAPKISKKTQIQFKAGDVVSEQQVEEAVKNSAEEEVKSDPYDADDMVIPSESEKDSAPVKKDRKQISSHDVAKSLAKRKPASFTPSSEKVPTRSSTKTAGPDDNSAIPMMSDEKEVQVVASIQADLAQKEEELHQEFAEKKAAKLSQLTSVRNSSGKVSPRVKKTKSSASSEINSVIPTESKEPLSSENLEALMVSDPVVKKAVTAVKTENAVLKKKLTEVVEMAQQDQKTIKELEKNTEQQTQKVEVLENDLDEAKESLETKKEALRRQSEKLKVLQMRISAMEVDVHSKQYDFKDKQLEYEKKLQAIEEEFGNYKSEKAHNEEELQEQLRILKEALNKKIAELNEAQEKLLFAENKLKKSDAQHAVTLRQYEDLKKTMADLDGRLTDLPSEMKTDAKPLVTVDPKNLPPPKNREEFMYQQWIQRHDKLISRLKEKLLWAREQMDYLGRYDIKLSDQKMAALKEQLAAVKKQLNSKDISSGKPEDYALMEERLKDSQERLEMVEKILREKDDQVKELEKQLNGVLSAF